MSGQDASTEAALARALAALWERYRSAALERVAILERAGESLAVGALDAAAAEQARGEAHKLAGSLGSFGIHEGTALAREAERLLGRGGDPERLRAVAAALRAVVERATAGPEA